MTEKKPITDERARQFYVHAIAWDMGEKPESSGSASARASLSREWDAWLAAHDARIRCDAYDEGYEDGQHDAHEHRPWRKSTHPYRQEQTNE